MTRMTATEASRRLSSVLSRAATGEEIEGVRGGVPVAVIGPVRTSTISAERYRELGAPTDPWPS